MSQAMTTTVPERDSATGRASGDGGTEHRSHGLGPAYVGTATGVMHLKEPATTNADAPADAIDAPPTSVKMMGPAVWRQLRANIVAVVSLAVALCGLSYNTWRNERTEANRNSRIAAFEVIKTLGELQVLVDDDTYHRGPGDATMGWRRVQCIQDLAQIVPSPGPQDAERLLLTWRSQVDGLATDARSAAEISDAIYQTRQDMVAIIRGLR